MPSRSPTGTQAKRSSPPRRAQAALFSRVNRELYKRNAELAVRNKTLALLRELDEISLSEVGMTDMGRQITEVVGTELGYEVVSIAIVDDADGGGLRWIALFSPVREIAAALGLFSPHAVVTPLTGKLVTAEVLRHPKLRLVSDIHAVYPPVLANALEAATRRTRQLRSTAVYPLRIGSRQALGVLVLSASRSLTSLTRYERQSIVGITGLVSLALYKAKVTEDLRRATAELRVANERLAELDKVKSEFLSIASHQLYTPMTAIRGYLSMIQEGDFGTVGGKIQPVVEILRSSSDRLIELIRILLDVSRIESGRLELTLDSTDIAEMARELVVELAPNAQRKSQTLRFTKVSAVPHVVADRQRLRQVLLNVTDNAIKYTPKKGRVDAAVEQRGSDVVFSVRDTGRGMSADELGRIFTKFTRVGGEREKYRTEGAGLGLYIARQIVREHRGDIWAESPGEGKGSMFFVRLPAEGSPEALKAGTKLAVGIKAAEASQRPEEAATKGTREAGGNFLKSEIDRDPSPRACGAQDDTGSA